MKQKCWQEKMCGKWGCYYYYTQDKCSNHKEVENVQGKADGRPQTDQEKEEPRDQSKGGNQTESSIGSEIEAL